MKISRVGVDLAKNVFQLHGVDSRGKAVWKRQLPRDKWLRALSDTVEPGALIGLAKGYTVKIIPPQFVTPFVKSNKNDANDAAAICEAMVRPNMYPVTVKTVEQQDLQAIHRIREEIKAHRVAKANQIRGLVTEYGLVAPKQLSSLRPAITDWLEDASNGLTNFFRQLLHGLQEDLGRLDQRMAMLDQKIAEIAKAHPTAKRLQQLRGVGPMGDGKQYRKGRDMAAAIGLTPRQHSSGGKDRLLGISKRGDAYLRCLLVHGARSAIRTMNGRDDRLSRWIVSLQARRHNNVVAVAMANKLARIAWVIMAKGVDYDPDMNLATVN